MAEPKLQAAPALDPQTLAERVAQGMFANDRASQAMGMELLEVGPGYARLAMRVRPEMLNGHAICHGGHIFTLADSAFAFACNWDNTVTVALACHITFIAPARAGDRLIAEAREVSRAGRTGVYDVTVSRDDGTLIAVFRGNSYRTRGQVIDLDPQGASGSDSTEPHGPRVRDGEEREGGCRR
jgi:acyl-CoA thioesterase